MYNYQNDGYEIVIIDLTQGEMSSNGNIFLRQKESEKAKKIMGAAIRKNLNLDDRNIEKNRKNIELIANVIREHKPDIIFYPNSVDSHPDHIAASNLISEGIFHSKLKRFVSEHSAFCVRNSFKSNRRFIHL